MADIFVKKTWTDRISEFITRRTLTKEDGSTEIVTVERNEGEVSQEGDAFDANTMNDLEDRIYSGFEQLNNDLKEIYKEMYIPNVKRYTVSASLSANGYIDKVITFDEPIDLAHSKVNLVGYYRHDASAYEAHPTNYFAQITNITSNNCTVNFRNNHTGSHVLEAIVEVEEWKKPTE